MNSNNVNEKKIYDEEDALKSPNNENFLFVEYVNQELLIKDLQNNIESQNSKDKLFTYSNIEQDIIEETDMEISEEEDLNTYSGLKNFVIQTLLNNEKLISLSNSLFQNNQYLSYQLSISRSWIQSLYNNNNVLIKNIQQMQGELDSYRSSLSKRTQAEQNVDLWTAREDERVSKRLRSDPKTK